MIRVLKTIVQSFFPIKNDSDKKFFTKKLKKQTRETIKLVEDRIDIVKKKPSFKKKRNVRLKGEYRRSNMTELRQKKFEIKIIGLKKIWMS